MNGRIKARVERYGADQNDSDQEVTVGFKADKRAGRR
jgi:hypothetical protein